MEICSILGGHVSERGTLVLISKITYFWAMDAALGLIGAAFDWAWFVLVWAIVGLTIAVMGSALIQTVRAGLL